MVELIFLRAQKAYLSANASYPTIIWTGTFTLAPFWKNYYISGKTIIKVLYNMTNLFSIRMMKNLPNLMWTSYLLSSNICLSNYVNRYFYFELLGLSEIAYSTGNI